MAQHLGALSAPHLHLRQMGELLPLLKVAALRGVGVEGGK